MGEDLRRPCVGIGLARIGKGSVECYAASLSKEKMERQKLKKLPCWSCVAIL